MPHFCGIFIKMISKVNLSTVTFSNEWRRILKSNNKNSKSFISIYLDLTEISNKSKDNFLSYKEHNDSVKNLLSVFGVSDISEIKTKHISLVKNNLDFKAVFEEFSKMLFNK